MRSKKNKKRILSPSVLLFILLGLCFLIASCNLSSKSSQEMHEEIKIGAIFPLTPDNSYVCVKRPLILV